MSGMRDGYVGTAQDVVRIRRLKKQREVERKKIQELKNKSASAGGQTGLLQFGSGTSDILETAFKKETVGLVTREEYVEKRVNICNKIEEEKEKLQKLQQEEEELQLEKRKKRKIKGDSCLSFADDIEHGNDEDNGENNPEQMRKVKEVLHVSTAPSIIMCREEEQKRVLEFCKACIEQQKAGSLYACGCPGTGKTLSMEKVKQSLLDWANEEGFQSPDVIAINCTSLANTSDIFIKIFKDHCPKKKFNGSFSLCQHLQNLFSQKRPSEEKMMLVIVDELDYLITKDRSVLHDIFMLTTFPFSRLILIGIANALDLAERFLPKLQSLNCKPVVITFRAYSEDQILRILQQRLMALPHTVFQPQALELCARKVAAVSGDMRKALSVCRNAIEMLESELRNPSKLNLIQADTALHGQPIMAKSLTKQELNVVRVDHMAIALSKTFKSAIVDTIQSLPQHQQIILCSVVKLFRNKKGDTTVGELNKSYMDICKSAQIPPSGTLEFSNMCRVLSDQGLLKLGKSREDRLKRVTLIVDEADITFALHGIRFFRNCLQ